jgi:hypothetical protein
MGDLELVVKPSEGWTVLLATLKLKLRLIGSSR